MGFYSARKKAGLSQAAVGAMLGVAPAAVCQWETGRTTPRSSLLPKIAKIYNCTVDDLLSVEEESPTTQD